MKRALGASELTLHQINKVCSTNFTIVVELDGRSDWETLKGSLKNWSMNYAILRVRIVEKEGGCYFKEISPAQLNLPLEEKTIDEKEDYYPHVEESLNRKFSKSDVLPWRVLHLLKGNKSILIFCFNHAVMDARSGFKLLNSFFNIYGSTRYSLKAIPLSKPVEEWVKKKTLKPIKTSLKLLTGSIFHKPAIKRPEADVSYGEREARVLSLPLSVECTKKIIGYCKGKYTVTAFFTAMMLDQSFMRILEKKKKNLSAIIAVDLTPSIKKTQGGLKTDLLGLYVSHIYITVAHDDRTSFEDLLEDVKKKMDRALMNEDPASYINLKRITSKAGRDPEKMVDEVEKFSPCSTMVSNGGILPLNDRCGDIPIENSFFAFSGTGSGNSSILLSFSTYKKKTTLQFLYNSPLTSKKEAQEFIYGFERKLDKVLKPEGRTDSGMPVYRSMENKSAFNKENLSESIR